MSIMFANRVYRQKQSLEVSCEKPATLLIRDSDTGVFPVTTAKLSRTPVLHLLLYYFILS